MQPHFRIMRHKLQAPLHMVGTNQPSPSTHTLATQAYASLNWVLTQEPLDVETELALGFLDYLLLGTSAAPLRKALNDSGLGEALVGGGIDDELKQPIFSVGLKVLNSKPDLLNTLGQQSWEYSCGRIHAVDVLPKALVGATLHTRCKRSP
jgi:Zn-dependent M16 (insulinase) family peptidase